MYTLTQIHRDTNKCLYIYIYICVCVCVCVCCVCVCVCPSVGVGGKFSFFLKPNANVDRYINGFSNTNTSFSLDCKTKFSISIFGLVLPLLNQLLAF